MKRWLIGGAHIIRWPGLLLQRTHYWLPVKNMSGAGGGGGPLRDKWAITTQKQTEDCHGMCCELKPNWQGHFCLCCSTFLTTEADVCEVHLKSYSVFSRESPERVRLVWTEIDPAVYIPHTFSSSRSNISHLSKHTNTGHNRPAVNIKHRLGEISLAHVRNRAIGKNDLKMDVDLMWN